jgi:hypothetical protein
MGNVGRCGMPRDRHRGPPGRRKTEPSLVRVWIRRRERRPGQRFATTTANGCRDGLAPDVCLTGADPPSDGLSLAGPPGPGRFACSRRGTARRSSVDAILSP